MANKVSIQGYEGSFHQMAAIEYYGKDTTVVPCANFRDVIKIASNKKESTGGIMAIENSIAGSILPNYTLLQKSDLSIVGEIYLQIKQNLMVTPGAILEDIREVQSHPMAILQCIDFLEKHTWKLIETEDTALSAKYVSKKRSFNIAAIASSLAADMFGLDILKEDIHTEKNNYTRFLVLKRTNEVDDFTDANKASVNFTTDHTKGSLAKVLAKIADGGINLSKLQSMPIAGSDFKYSFHADMEFENVAQFNKVVTQVKTATDSLKILGVYKKGNISK